MHQISDPVDRLNISDPDHISLFTGVFSLSALQPYMSNMKCEQTRYITYL